MSKCKRLPQCGCNKGDGWVNFKTIEQTVELPSGFQFSRLVFFLKPCDAHTATAMFVMCKKFGMWWGNVHESTPLDFQGAVPFTYYLTDRNSNGMLVDSFPKYSGLANLFGVKYVD